MHTVHIGSSSYFLPSKWDELNAKQLRHISWISFLNLKAVDVAKLLFLVQTLSLPFRKRIRLQYFYFFQADTTERGDLLFCTSSFQESRTLTRQKIKKIRCAFVLLHGPNSALSNSTFWEFIKAEQCFLNYLEKKDDIWLDKLIATLYRPSKDNFNTRLENDRRIALNDHEVTDRLKLISRIDKKTKIAVLMWFDGCRTHLIKYFPLIWKKPGPNQQVDKKTVKNTNWMQLISELAGSMDNYEKIGNTNLYIALTDISHRIKKRNEELKQLALSARKRH
jgi:hypothetical protein